GFDNTRETLIVRDPYRRHTHEFRSEQSLEHYASSGPRGMAMVPVDKGSLLEGVELPEADLYDVLYRLNEALDRHDRSKAAAELAVLQGLSPDHRLTLQAQRTLAIYDANSTEQLVAIEKLLLQFPKDANLQLSHLSCLRNLVSREKRLEKLKETCAAKDSDPLLWREYAYELSLDAREFTNAMRWLKRVDRARPMDSYSIHLRANILWNQREFAESCELYRFAASLDDKKEFLASSYLTASRSLKQTESALAFLADRFHRYGKLSHQPVTTLFWAYTELSRLREAFEVLEKALALRPEDGELFLYAADAYARYNQPERAWALLKCAEARTQRSNWLRTSGVLADYAGDLKSALVHWRTVLELEPLALDAYRGVARLTAETEGYPATLQLLEQACERFPHHFSLHTIWIDWLRREGDAAIEPVLRRLTEIDPINAWARRELAFTLGQLGKWEEAFIEAELAIQLEPSDSYSFNVRGWLHLHSNAVEKAKPDLHKAISLSVDNGPAINNLLQACSSLAERKEAVAFVEQELIRQVVFGDGLLEFRNVARPIHEPAELLASLQAALAARPDLWHAWSAVIQQLTDMQRLDEAMQLATKATEQFPLLPRLWIDFARIHRARLDSESEVSAIEKAVQLSPGWGFAVRQLCEAHERRSDLRSARAVMERHIGLAPLDSFSHGYLADVLWKSGEKSAALDRLQQALQINSEYDWAWSTANRWARELNQPNLVQEMARNLTISRPGQPQNWIVLARTLDWGTETDAEEALKALDRAIELNPRHVDAWDLKAGLLTDLRRFEEALKACRPKVFGARIPTSLRSREAWVVMRQGQMKQAIRLLQGVSPTIHPITGPGNN
ncbi:MAG: hypothetical protein ACK4UN_13585, partial [Limisphaerales bacterium]